MDGGSTPNSVMPLHDIDLIVAPIWSFTPRIVAASYNVSESNRNLSTSVLKSNTKVIWEMQNRRLPIRTGGFNAPWCWNNGKNWSVFLSQGQRLSCSAEFMQFWCWLVQQNHSCINIGPLVTFFLVSVSRTYHTRSHTHTYKRRQREAVLHYIHVYRLLRSHSGYRDVNTHLGRLIHLFP